MKRKSIKALVKRGNWYLDSGCSNHMDKDETIFKSIDESFKVKVRLGNGLEGKEKGGSLCAKKGKRRREVLGKVGGKGRGKEEEGWVRNLN